ncbi:MAG: AAA family ATPase [Nannocystaceae bacterium]
MSESLHVRIDRALRAGARVLWLETREEDRALALLEDVGGSLEWPVRTWSLARGCDGDAAPRGLGDLLGDLLDARADALWVLLDAAPPLSDARLRRSLRELAQRRGGPAAIVVSPDPPPPSLPEVVALRLPLPDVDALRRGAARVARRLRLAGHARAEALLDEVGDRLARLGLGLDLRAFERLVGEALLSRGAGALPHSDALVAFVAAHKPDALRGALLERVQPAAPELLGGLDGLRRWLERRALALDPRARAAAIPDPRGVLLVGVQGCGKSLAARVSAAILGLPLVRLDPGRIFAGTVGASEANLREVTELAERLAPLVLWIDEIDRGFAGSDGGASDGGTAARVFGGLLTWLQERARPVFVVATANHLDRLPPELLRRGRLDEVFFVDLPDAASRRAIAAVHLETAPARSLGEAPPLADPLSALLDLAAAAEGFSGAEIEAAIVEARLDAFADGRPLAAADLERALAATVPLSRARSRELEALRRWAEGGARRA